LHVGLEHPCRHGQANQYSASLRQPSGDYSNQQRPVEACCLTARRILAKVSSERLPKSEVLCANDFRVPGVGVNVKGSRPAETRRRRWKTPSGESMQRSRLSNGCVPAREAVADGYKRPEPEPAPSDCAGLDADW